MENTSCLLLLNERLKRDLAQESLPPTLDGALQDMPVDMHNSLVFSLSPKRSAEALAFLAKSRLPFAKRVVFCFRAGMVKEAARLHEQIEDYKRAAEIYQKNGYCSDALPATLKQVICPAWPECMKPWKGTRMPSPSKADWEGRLALQG